MVKAAGSPEIQIVNLLNLKEKEQAHASWQKKRAARNFSLYKKFSTVNP
jgi:hypothetical protein